jgi:pentatricopeptide repeat protein
MLQYVVAFQSTVTLLGNRLPTPRRLYVANVNDHGHSIPTAAYGSTEEFNAAIHQLCREGPSVANAVELLRSGEAQSAAGGINITNNETYVTILKAMVSERYPPSVVLAEEVFESMKKRCGNANVNAYNALIATWAKTREKASPHRAEELLAELWRLYDTNQDIQWMPNRATYMSVMTCWAWCGEGDAAARRTEELLEEMESYRKSYSTLSPTTPFVNVVLNAWSKSQSQGAAQRSEVILNRMVELGKSGRKELQPNTISFNTVIDCLARSGELDAEWRAEELLGRMDELAKMGAPSEPDTVSFNTVLATWSKSRQKNAAQRAEDILRHMERRYESRSTTINPDASSYASVMHAWARSAHPQKHEKAGNILARMQSAYERGNLAAKPNAMVYNTMINVWAKSQDPNAGTLAMDIFDSMKNEGLRPDVFTYTSLMDVFAKQGTIEAGEKARLLLDDMEQEYKETGRLEIKPNVRTYTSVINAIARSRSSPEDAEGILDRMADANIKPDVVCYNAVINAYGWSDFEGKEQRAYAVFNRMLASYRAGTADAKPDIITCNSILNACAFAMGGDRAAAMQVAIDTLETFQSAAPEFGFPNHVTYGNMLTCISRQMPQSEKGCDLAEATFWQCCAAGHVSALVIHSLRAAVTPTRLKTILGPALIANDERSFIFEMHEMPFKWKQFAPRKATAQRKPTRPSTKRDEPEITKQYNNRPN